VITWTQLENSAAENDYCLHHKTPKTVFATCWRPENCYVPQSLFPRTFQTAFLSIRECNLYFGVSPMIHDSDGTDILADWMKRQCAIRAEFTAGNISVWFTGRVSYHSRTELILERDGDELSLSLFCGAWRVISPPEGSGYARVVVVTTDANTACTLYKSAAASTGDIALVETGLDLPSDAGASEHAFAT